MLLQHYNAIMILVILCFNTFKKLYLISDDVVAILSGTKEEMEALINNFPVLGNQFPNIFILNHIQPDNY